ncbi:hypothetical protein LPB72_09900 [Hydrogenophaga crassostreae]|uniref:Uncharacterized protein n=1 Tax=Hydrogenophaga crassostreae TaxID=1763535 RepID=A0A167HRF7_9BURK|nr:hypothetical protein [Hydrogenophaga crassostreae]AOW13349.1 hypothetical protein LPB072_11280 [Hydrogenophaga crassostreae]OAD41632.1 hypothetical protein LPB72_09900 [Hydrogenophaga crassostreae]
MKKNATLVFMKEKPQLTLIEGGQPSFEAEVARLVEKPDGVAAWAKLKRLARKSRPAANSLLADVSANCQEAPPSEPDQPNIHG